MVETITGDERRRRRRLGTRPWTPAENEEPGASIGIVARRYNSRHQLLASNPAGSLDYAQTQPGSLIDSVRDAQALFHHMEQHAETLARHNSP